MEPEGSLLHSPMPATCPYPEPAQSNPYPHISIPELIINLILYSHLCLGIPSGLFPQPTDTTTTNKAQSTPPATYNINCTEHVLL